LFKAITMGSHVRKHRHKHAGIGKCPAPRGRWVTGLKYLDKRFGWRTQQARPYVAESDIALVSREIDDSQYRSVTVP
jgi:hypothetical protein